MELTRSRQDGCSVTPNVALMRNSNSTPLLRMRCCKVGLANLGMTPAKSLRRGWLTEEYESILKSPTESDGQFRYFRLSNTSHVNSDLKQGDTPTELLNTAYRKLVADVDPALHRYLVRVGKRRGEPKCRG
jgi:hypothetical protein